MKPRYAQKFLKRVSRRVACPASYPTGGFTVVIGELVHVEKVLNVHIEGGGEYLAQYVSKTGNQVTVKIRVDIEKTITWSDLGTASATFATEEATPTASGVDKFGAEATAGTDLSALYVIVEVEGY